MDQGMLYLVATPIGNMKDISLRALEVLGAADIIACEDTRRSLILLNHYGIKKKLISCREHNESRQADYISRLLAEGKSVVLITDAGSPGISDPGDTVVRKVLDAGFPVTAIPGACAAIAALSVSGIYKRGFVFLGFLPPKKKDKLELTASLIDLKLPLIFYSAAHDVNDDLDFLYSRFGGREAVIARELTKVYEEITRGNLSGLRAQTGKGEFVIIIGGKPDAADDRDIDSLYEEFAAEGLEKKDIIKKIAVMKKIKKDEVYKRLLEKPSS